jgi:hypothetical protein
MGHPSLFRLEDNAAAQKLHGPRSTTVAALHSEHLVGRMADFKALNRTLEDQLEAVRAELKACRESLDQWKANCAHAQENARLLFELVVDADRG